MSLEQKSRIPNLESMLCATRISCSSFVVGLNVVGSVMGLCDLADAKASGVS